MKIFDLFKRNEIPTASESRAKAEKIAPVKTMRMVNDYINSAVLDGRTSTDFTLFGDQIRYFDWIGRSIAEKGYAVSSASIGKTVVEVSIRWDGASK